MSLAFERIAIIGFGEAGTILGEELVRAGCTVVTYDVLIADAQRRQAVLERAQRAGVRVCDGTPAAVQEADLVISAVTASASGEVAALAATRLRPGQVFLDINSVAPATKLVNARSIEPSGADFVEAAVMAPVPAQRLAVPMLLGGRRAAEVAQALRALGMNATAIADRVGVAAAVKMCRSIIIKGLEALTLESMLAARRLGAEREVLASLHQSYPHMDWQGALPDYLLSRVAEHGRRRAAEMREVARTLEEIGIDPMMAAATAKRQDALIDAMASQGLGYPRDRAFSWRELADVIANSEN
jgi:3-hydroxyisobutyrate dehydrogenase-like beta-hydroxyacid dehydrogenase